MLTNLCAPPPECYEDDCCEELALRLALLEGLIADLLKLFGNQGGTDVPKLLEVYLKAIRDATRQADTSVTISMESALQNQIHFNNTYKLLKGLFDNLNNTIIGTELRYRIKDITTERSLEDDDFVGNVILNYKAEVPFTLVPNSKVVVGQIIHIRNGLNKPITVKTNGVTVSPEDSLYLRREGSSIGLIYVGGNAYHAYGELP